MIDGYKFSQQQERNFIERGATVIEYADLSDRGVEWFVEAAFDVKLPPAERRLNSGDGHIAKLLSLPLESRSRFAAWLDSEDVTEILLSDRATRQQELPSTIKDRVASIVRQASA